MIGWVTILIIGRLLIPLMRGMNICLLQSFPGSCGKKSVCTHRVLQRKLTQTVLCGTLSQSFGGCICMGTREQQRSTSFTGKGRIFMVTGEFHSFISFEKMHEYIYLLCLSHVHKLVFGLCMVDLCGARRKQLLRSSYIEHQWVRVSSTALADVMDLEGE